MIKKITNYYRSAKEELWKVIFPTKQQLKISFIAVVVVVSVITLFLALVDLILSSSMSSIL
ncbi:preprotein translocase subunit SecE [Helicobacter kayseriensis]|uniref:preprotein translocase subunit SecE n=1 Tax=Helicobacter kayseriensis TaxID=2905877 RepID=UPI001E37BD64|nr:preprotein translocase subunit SecE [Helicobacter kayseriensis]MCE3046953.1 preprotein translocase subunit SecE [Helicobacter kayseriensis]MCE3048387.1 preprotein translocase subunit SecE [Helicobacter kayseriensis]